MLIPLEVHSDVLVHYLPIDQLMRLIHVNSMFVLVVNEELQRRVTSGSVEPIVFLLTNAFHKEARYLLSLYFSTNKPSVNPDYGRNLCMLYWNAMIHNDIPLIISIARLSGSILFASQYAQSQGFDRNLIATCIACEPSLVHDFSNEFTENYFCREISIMPLIVNIGSRYGLDRALSVYKEYIRNKSSCPKILSSLIEVVVGNVLDFSNEVVQNSQQILQLLDDFEKERQTRDKIIIRIVDILTDDPFDKQTTNFVTKMIAYNTIDNVKKILLSI